MDSIDLVRRVVKEILEGICAGDRKSILCLFSAGMLGAEESLIQLLSLEKRGYSLCSVLTPNAENLFNSGRTDLPDMPGRRSEKDETGTKITWNFVSGFDLVVVAVMTVNTAAKTALGIADNNVTEALRLSILRGKKIIAVCDACDMRNPLFQNAPAPYMRTVTDHLAALQSYGLTLVNACNLAGTVLALHANGRAGRGE